MVCWLICLNFKAKHLFTARDGVFVQVLFQQQEQKTAPKTGPPDNGRIWGQPFELYVCGIRANFKI